MRIAVTGTHGSGKTTLIDDFVATRPAYRKEVEPYWSLLQRGVVFADGASIPDLEEQLEASVAMLLAAHAGEDMIFDRCPIDFIAYLEVVGEKEGIDWTPSGNLLGRIEKALATLDLLVFVPLRSPDDIKVAIELPRLRLSVDRRLKSILRDDALGFFKGGSPPIVEVSGSRQDRVQRLAGAASV